MGRKWSDNRRRYHADKGHDRRPILGPMKVTTVSSDGTVVTRNVNQSHAQIAETIREGNRKSNRS